MISELPDAAGHSSRSTLHDVSAAVSQRVPSGVGAPPSGVVQRGSCVGSTSAPASAALPVFLVHDASATKRSAATTVPTTRVPVMKLPPTPILAGRRNGNRPPERRVAGAVAVTAAALLPASPAQAG